MSVEKNKNVAETYHQMRADDVESILTPDFIGHGPNDFTWTRSDHVGFATNLKGSNTIHNIVAEGQYVVVHFHREGTFANFKFDSEMMHMMRLTDGKIAEIWEFMHSQPTEM